MKRMSFLVVLLLATINLWARVVYVDSSNVAGFQNGTSWLTAYSSFQAGINNAHAGDSVWVAKATYSPASGTSFSMKDSVKIFGGFTNTNTSFSQRNIVTNATILKGNKASVFLNLSLSNASLLDGFTITNGTTASSLGGGGMYNNNNASPTINNCTFINDTADNRGGAIRNYEASPIITNCIFSQNASGYAGGAICNSYYSTPVISNCSFTGNKIYPKYGYLFGGAIYNEQSSFATISNCSFTTNELQTSGSGDANGGAICNDGGGCEVTNCTFSGNLVSNIGNSTTQKSTSKGAAIFTNSKLMIENCTFSDNIAFNGTKSIGKGTIYSSGGTDSTCTINNSLFTKNSATQGGAIYCEQSRSNVTKCIFAENKAIYGGGAYNKKSALSFIDCIFTKDTATAGGGCIVNDEPYTLASPWVTNTIIVNCLFTQNIADSFGGTILNQKASPKIVNSTIVNGSTLYNSGLYGGGIYNRQNSFPSISNTIVWGNTSGVVNDLSSVPSVLYSLIQGYPANATNHLIAGTTDPLFENATGGNFRLQFTSPCINKGRNDSLSTSIVTDLGGTARIVNDTVDLGPYEYMLAVKLGPDTSICTGDTLLLDAHNPGSTYLWSNGATTQTIKVTANGTYYVAVTNTVGTTRDTIVVQLRTLPVVNIGNDTSFCIGNSVTLTAPSGKTYLWSTGSVKSAISVNSSGIYAVKITDSYGCSNRDTINITVNPLPVANLGNDTAICIGSSLTLDVQNTGATYLWSDNSTTQTLAVSAAGTYSVLVTDTHGCKGRDTININTLSLPTVNLGNDTIVCSGTSLTLDAQNTGANYLWSTNATTQTINVNAAGKYRVSVTDANGCSKSDTLDVGIYSLPTVALGNDTAICAGASIVFDAQNTGAIYTWNTSAATQTITVSTAGSYNVSVTDANGCVNNDTINLSINALPIITLGNDTTVCMGSSLVLNAGNTGSTYIWNTSATTQTITVSTAGSYNVSVTDINSCSKSDTIDVGTYSLPRVTLGNDTAICAGYSLTINAQNPGATYLWNTSATTQTISVSTAGSYNVSVTDANGCVNSDTINLSINALPVVNLGNDTAICDGNTLTLDAMNTGSIYKWNTGTITQTLDVSAAGTYDVTVTDANNCSSSDTIQISINPLPIVNLGNDTTLFPNIILTLNADNPGAIYLWNTGATTQTIDVDDNGTYIVNVTDVNTCSNRDTIIVNFIPVSVNHTILKDPVVTITPNPTRAYIIITINDNKLIGSKAVLTDMSGKNIQVIDIYETQQKVSLQGLTAGTYILRLQNNQAFRIIKQD